MIRTYVVARGPAQLSDLDSNEFTRKCRSWRLTLLLIDRQAAINILKTPTITTHHITQI